MDLEYLYALQCLREQLPQWFSSALNIFADFWIGPVLFFIAILMLWNLDPRQGRIMLLSAFISLGVNAIMKNIACVYRPWLRDSRLHIFPEAAARATGYSFPSGHSTMAGSFSSSFGYYLRTYRHWLLIPCILLGLSVPFIRNWLGAHTPQDVIVGFIIGVLCTFIAIKLVDWVDEGINRDIVFTVVCVIISIASLIFIANKPYPMDYLPDGSLIADPALMMRDGFKSFGALMGFSLGWLIERRYAPLEMPAGRRNFILRIVACLVLIFIVFVILHALLTNLVDKNIETFIQLFVLLFTAEGIAPVVFRKLKI